MSIIPLTVPPKKLAQTISATAMAFKMNNIEGWNGTDLAPADFGTEAFGVFINSTRTQIEIFSFDPATIADAEITILARGLGYSGQTVEDAARKFPWPSNDTTIQLGTDAPQLFRDFISESNIATITALHTYNVLPQSAVTPANDEDFTTKQYVDGLTEPAITVPVNQVAHGLTVGQVIRVNGANLFTPAQADSATNSEVVGIVSEVVDVDNFKYITEGVFEDASSPAFAAGTVVFLSRTVAGALTDTDTTTIGEVSAPLGIIVENGAKMIFHRYRPAVINSISGNPIASETVAGMVEQATPTQVANGDDVGETGAPLFVVPSRIPSSAIKRTANLLASMNGSVTPVATGIIDDYAFPMTPTARAFAGFMIEDKSSVALIPDFLNVDTNNFNTATQTYVGMSANAGNDRVMVIYYWSYNTQTPPTGVTWNSIAGTLVDSVNFSTGGNVTTFIIPLGDSGSLQSFDLIFSGGTTGTGNVRIMHALVYDKASQTPADHSAFSIGGGGSSKTLTGIVPSQGYGRISGFTAYSQAQFINSDTSWTLRATNGAGTDSGDFLGAAAASLQANQASGSNDIAIASVALAGVGPADTASVQVSGIIGGFVGLTKGETYFADAAGAIALTGGVQVGIAISTTEILITPQPQVVGGVSAGGSGTQTIYHALGVIPKVIRISGMSGANGSFPGCHSIGSFDGVTNQCVYVQGKSTSRNAQTSTTFAVRLAENISGSESGIATGVVQNVTETTFDIVWTGSNTSEDFYWEAQG